MMEAEQDESGIFPDKAVVGSEEESKFSQVEHSHSPVDHVVNKPVPTDTGEENMEDADASEESSPESPMQQSPDQSNLSDRSAELSQSNEMTETEEFTEGKEVEDEEMENIDELSSGELNEDSRNSSKDELLSDKDEEEHEVAGTEADDSQCISSSSNKVEDCEYTGDEKDSVTEDQEKSFSESKEKSVSSVTKVNEKDELSERRDLDAVSEDENSLVNTSKEDVGGVQPINTAIDNNAMKECPDMKEDEINETIDKVQTNTAKSVSEGQTKIEMEPVDSDDELDLTKPEDSSICTDKTSAKVNEEKQIEEKDNIGETLDDSKTDVDRDLDKKEDSEAITGQDENNDAKSEASLEEVSDEEGEIEEGEAEEDEAEEGEAEDGSGIEEVSEEEEEEREDKGPQSGVEEVSEEESSGAEEEEGSENEQSEGVEDVSSDEEDEDRADDDDECKVSSSRTVQVKQNGEVVSFDDASKDNRGAVQEVLENMTIKIDNVKDSSNVDHDKDSGSRRDKERSKDRKERKDSAKSRNTSGSLKDMRDINERLKAQASYGEDVELDYDDVHDEGKDKAGSGDEGAISTGSESDDGELEEEEDCEEGEIREPGSKPFIKPTCRFFMRGHCTWGINCRFLHPGVNDKGNYQLIERPGFNNKPPQAFEEQWEEEEKSPTPEPPPAPEPKEESAWERGLRQAKELRKKALERRELEPNFEQKKLNLSIDDNPEYNKENTIEGEERSPAKKHSSYYDKLEPLSDDEYYDQTPVRLQQKQQSEQTWMPGQYENFEVRWSREPYYPPPAPQSYPDHGGPPPARYSPMYPPHQSFPGRDRYPPARPPPQRHYSPSPPPQTYPRYPNQREPREMRREKIHKRHESPPMQKPLGGPPNSRPRADEWHDPWDRSNVNKAKSPGKKRSRSRGRRRSRRSHSYSSSYSSSSYSGSSRSRSRSSSFSSVSSRSRSRSKSSSFSSRSPSPRRNQPGDRQRRPFQGPGPRTNRRVPSYNRPGDHPRGSMGFQGPPGRGPDKRPGNMPQSPTKGPRGHHHPMAGPPPRGPPPQRMDMERKGEKPPVAQQQRKFQLEIKSRDRPLPPSALTKDRPRKPHPRGGSSSTSRSRSRSSSSSSRSSKSSYSSRSSRSRSSSTSSSGSADSDHLYRNIGGRENQKPPRGRGNDKGKPRSPQGDRRPAGMKPNSKVGPPKQGEFGKPMSAPQQKPKDPMKMTGQKSNIKLTLIKPNDKSGSARPSDPGPKKRPADVGADAPPPKRPNMANTAKLDKPVKKPEKPMVAVPGKAPARAPGPAVKPSAPPGAVGPGPAAPVVAIKKKSTVSRREELLKQLKAVEDAIAKKKKKMN